MCTLQKDQGTYKILFQDLRVIAYFWTCNTIFNLELNNEVDFILVYFIISNAALRNAKA